MNKTHHSRWRLKRRKKTRLVGVDFFPYRDYRLAYEIHGDTDAPTVILVHGILLDSACNRDLAVALAEQGYRVVLLDLLGHGRSDKPGHAKELRVDFFAEQVHDLMDHLELERAVIGGVSLGAITTLSFATRWPERCKALFLEMPVMERAAPAAALMLVPVIGLAHYAASPLRALGWVLKKMSPPRSNTLKVGYNLLTQDPRDVAAIIHGVLVGPVVPSRRERETLTMPTMIIGHGRDWLHNLEDAKILHKEMPNAEFHVAKSVFELRLKPHRLMPRIIDFMRRVEPTP